MNEITREKYEKMLRDAFGTIAGNSHLEARHQALNIVNNILIDMGIPIPEKSILPGVTGGVWGVTGPYGSDGHYSISAQYSGSGPVLAHMLVRDAALADARVMAGSKKLVKLAVKGLRAAKAHEQFVRFSAEALAVIDQLDKMGVAVIEFEEVT